MRHITITNCTVELSVPDALELLDVGDRESPKIKLFAGEYVDDVVVHYCDRPGVDRKLVVKRLFLRELCGDMLPVVDADGNVVLFTSDAPTSVSPIGPAEVVQ